MGAAGTLFQKVLNSVANNASSEMAICFLEVPKKQKLGRNDLEINSYSTTDLSSIGLHSFSFQE